MLRLATESLCHPIRGGNSLVTSPPPIASMIALLVLYLQEILHLCSAWYGILLAVGAVGGLSGGFFAAALTRRVGAKVTTLICLALTTAGQLALRTTSSVIAVAAVLATSSMAFAIWNVQARSTIQRAVPADLLGRVVSINRVVIAAGSLVVPHLVALPPAASDFMPRSFSATRF